MIKMILCDGDSWTAGDIVDPKKFGNQTEHVHHPDNTEYRLPRVWPYKLGKLLGVDVFNNSYAGSSNDGIVRRIIPATLKLLEDYKPEELFVIVGWTSPERKDFFYDDEFRVFFPPEIMELEPKDEIDEFKKIYVKYFWEQQEYITRYAQQNYLLHYFFKNKGIKHYFFDAFYEKKYMKCDSNGDEVGGMYNNIELDEEKLPDKLQKIRDEVFKDKSFRNFLMIDEEHFNDDLWDGYHPSEKGHNLWAKELYEDLNDKINNI